MRTVSDAFLRTIRASHRMVAEARVVPPGQTGIDPDGVEIEIIDGDVQLDSTADIRSTVDLTTNGYRRWSSDPGALLSPYGPELWIRRGVETRAGLVEWIELGYHKIYSIEQDRSPDGPIRIEARDRMAGIKEALMIKPRQFGSGATVNSFFTTLVHEIYPTVGITFDFDATTTAIGRTVIVDEDRYGALLDLARAQGKVFFFDHLGNVQVKSPPNPAEPVFVVDQGRGGVFISGSRRLTRDGIFNAVIATGEAPDNKPPARAVARDMNPKSPSYWNGPFGKVVTTYSSPLLHSAGQAATAALNKLARTLGRPYSVDFSAVPNPALEPLDPVRIRTREGSEIHALEKITIPLIEDVPLSASTLEQTGINIEIGGE